MYMWQRVKALKLQGITIKEITRQLKLSRNTVRKYLRSNDAPSFSHRRTEKGLDKYEATIGEMLENKYIGTRIYKELSAIGYGGSLSSVHRYVADITKGEKKKALVTTRVESEPGSQMQYDWKEWELPINGKAVKIYIHEVVLSYSRMKYYACSLSITTSDVLRAIEEAILYFGGIAPEIVIDNPKQMVILHEKNGVVRYNDEFLKFCGLYGLQPNPCKNYRARTKGKAERPFYYVQEHLLRGLGVKSLSEFDVMLRQMMDKYNGREHSSLKEIPYERYLREKGLLKNIPKVEPTTLYGRPVRTVSNDGYVSFNGSFYPVPMVLCLNDVNVESVFGKQLRIYDKGLVVAEFRMEAFDKGIKPTHPEHEAINRQYREKRQVQMSDVVRRFLELFPNGSVYIEGLKKAEGPNVYWHISEITKFAGVYPKHMVQEALDACIEIGAYHKNSVKSLLSALTISEPVVEAVFNPIMHNTMDITRGLSCYKVAGEL